MPKKSFLVLTSLPISLLLVFSACAPIPVTMSPLVTNTQAPSRKTPSPSPTASPARIEVSPGALNGVSLKVSYAFTGTSASFFNDQLAEFNTLNPWGITLYPTPGGSYNILFETVSAQIGSPEQPDLVITLPEQVLAWDEQGAILDLQPYLLDPRYGFTKSDLDDFEPIFWGGSGQDDKRLGLPALLSSHFIFYNQTWAQELGFKKPPFTSTEFREQACAANQSFRQDLDLRNDGYGGWIVNTDPTAVLAWMLAFGGGVVRDGHYTFPTRENHTALDFLKILYDDGCAYLSTEPTPYLSFARRSTLFITGTLAEIPDQMLTFEQAGNNDQWTLIPFPGQMNRLVAEGPQYTLLRSTPEKQLAAWLFVRWLLSTENQVRWVEATGMFPLRTSAMEALSSYRRDHKQWAAAINYMEDLAIQPELASWRTGRLVLGDAAQSIFRLNLTSDQISTALVQMDQTMQELTERKVTPTP